jgi:uncharacterized protein YraI
MVLLRAGRRVLVIAAATALTGLFALVAPEPGFAARPNGYPITNVNLRAGPSTEYPVIVTVPNRAPIAILGCLADSSWCDVLFQGSRGWMRSIYLAGFYQGYYYPLRDYAAPRLGYSVVAFDIGNYWDSNYRDRPFYGERPRWQRPPQEGFINKAVFYNRLAPYGEWVWLQGQYVWVPNDVGRQWRPYTYGRWIYTDQYGWMWASDEPFGWATYHYGRWGFSNRVGWFWVPGSRWAPAWVSWRSSEEYLAWAPLPPAYDERVSIDVSDGDVPDYYWQVVPSRSFLSADLRRDVVRDGDRARHLRGTRALGNVRIDNNVVVNNVVTPKYVEEKTNERVVPRKVRRTKDAAQAGKIEGAAVEVFEPAADEAPVTPAPTKPKKIEEVAAESQTKEQAGSEPSTEEMLAPPEIKVPAAKAATSDAPPPPEPPKQGEPPLPEETAPPPPPPPPAPAVETAPEAAAPDAGAPPPPPPVEEGPPPPPPPPAAKDEVPPPAPEEAAPPEVQPPPAMEKPKAKDGGPKAKKGKGEGADDQPAMEPEVPAPPPPPPPPEEVAPPPPPPVEEVAPPPPPAEDVERPKAKKDGKRKKDQREEAQPEEPSALEPVPPPPPIENVVPPPPPQAEGDAPPNGKKKGAPQPEPCPEGTTLLDDGSCAPPPQ